MTAVIELSVHNALPPRRTPAATAWRLPPRVYSPLRARRVVRPMAIPRETKR